MIDAYSRVAYSEILSIEDAEHCTAFLQRAVAWFAGHGVPSNASSPTTASAIAARVAGPLRRARYHPYPHPALHPTTNGKAERFNPTLLDEWAYVRTYRSDLQPTDARDRWLHPDNHHRCHTALDGQPPRTRINNKPGQNNYPAARAAR